MLWIRLLFRFSEVKAGNRLGSSVGREVKALFERSSDVTRWSYSFYFK